MSFASVSHLSLSCTWFCQESQSLNVQLLGTQHAVRDLPAAVQPQRGPKTTRTQGTNLQARHAVRPLPPGISGTKNHGLEESWSVLQRFLPDKACFCSHFTVSFHLCLPTLFSSRMAHTRGLAAIQQVTVPLCSALRRPRLE